MASPVSQTTNQADAVEYARRVYGNVLDWYRNADAKAQVILTLDGAFLTLLSTSVFAKHDEVLWAVKHFSPETWVALALMCVSLTGSIISALMCLRSRTYSRNELRTLLGEAGVEGDNSETYTPQVMFFFQMLSQLHPMQLAQRLQSVGKNFEIEALANQLVPLSNNVSRKHIWVNRGFLLAGTTLILFLIAVVAYVARLVMQPLA